MMRIALVGNPNSGKTTLFNQLTGTYQTVGNWPGVTVEKKEGWIKGAKDMALIDLPGIYSLSPYSLEEIVTRDYIAYERPDLIINIIDGSNLERNLYLTSQVMEVGIPVLIALNMMDVVKRRGDEIDIPALEKKLNTQIIPISAVKGEGMEALIHAIHHPDSKLTGSLMTFNSPIEDAIDKTVSLFTEDQGPLSRYNAIKLLEEDPRISKEVPLKSKEEMDELIDGLHSIYDEDTEAIFINARYDLITDLLRGVYHKKYDHSSSITEKIDRIVTNKYLALPIFFGILWFIYWISVTTVGEYTIGVIEGGVENLQSNLFNFLTAQGANEMLISLFVNGIIGSLGAVFTFLPQLMILFLCLGLLEDTGYMSRIAFIMDRLFRRFGLSGKSIIPMLVGTGCSVPGIMATRTIENKKDRELTILLTPFMPCGAKLPIFGMIIAMMFPGASWVGPSVYFIALGGIILSGLFLKQFGRYKGDSEPFILELPSYHIPSFKGTMQNLINKAKEFIAKAGTIIFLGVLLIWFLQSFSPGLKFIGDEIELSILARFGKSIQWLFKPLGFGDWAPVVSVLTGFVAKEMVVATMASIGQVAPIVFTQVSAFAFMVFIIFSAPCFAAIGAMKSEFGSVKKTLKALGYQMGFAYVLSFLVNFIGSKIFAGANAMKPMVLDYNNIEAMSESLDISNGGHNFIYFLLAGLVIGGVIILFNHFSENKRRSEQS